MADMSSLPPSGPGAFDGEPALSTETHNVSPARKRWVTFILATSAAIVIVVAIIGIRAAIQANQDQQYLSALRADTESRIEGLSDEQLLTSMRVTCERIADGQTLDDANAAANRNWSTVSSMTELTKSEYQGNVRALFRAAEKVCG